MGTFLQHRRTLRGLTFLAVLGVVGLLGHYTVVQDQKVSVPQIMTESYASSTSDSAKQATANTSKPQFTMEIPKLKQTIPVSTVGLTKAGEMGVPSDPANAGWYKYGARPGQTGNAVIDGHNRILGKGNGVFWNIHKLATGDDIYIQESSSSRLHYIVRSSQTYQVASAPMTTIFGSSEQARLNLITCAGKWDKKIQNYTQRLVVYAELADESGGLAKL